jgi:hypothetical protein
MATRAARAVVAKLLANEGDAAAQFVYGKCLERGNDVDVDEMPANISDRQGREPVRTAN